MTFSEILRAMSAVELAEAALSRACALMSCEQSMRDSLHLALYRFEIDLITTEREVRGLWSPDWTAQAAIELARHFPAPQPGKPKPGKPRLDVDLAGAPPQAIATAAILLARAAAIAVKGGQLEVSGILASFATALDRFVPDAPRAGRGGSALLN